MEVSTDNLYKVAVNGDGVSIVIHSDNHIISRESAVNLAAYLLAVAAPTGAELTKALGTIRETIQKG